MAVVVVVESIPMYFWFLSFTRYGFTSFGVFPVS
jgi:hypothetical protein